MNQLSTTERAEIVGLLCEGMSIRAISRTLEVAKNTVVRLLCQIGKACTEFQDEKLRGLGCMVVQCDEICSFVGCKEKHATPEKKAEGQGNAWTWTDLDSDTKLIITWHIGGRGDDDAKDFMFDLADRLTKRIQLSTDGHNAYKNAVRLAFGPNVDYGLIIKVYGADTHEQKRYSPAVCTNCITKSVIGDPHESQISTSHVERSNLTLRMPNRRMTRLTNAFGKSLENHAHALALTFMFYNFARPNQMLTKKAGFKTTPAMTAGVSDYIWMVAEIVGLLG